MRLAFVFIFGILPNVSISQVRILQTKFFPSKPAFSLEWQQMREAMVKISKGEEEKP